MHFKFNVDKFGLHEIDGKNDGGKLGAGSGVDRPEEPADKSEGAGNDAGEADEDVEEAYVTWLVAGRVHVLCV